MTQSRRNFLGAAASLVAVSAWGAASLAAQDQDQTQTRPPLTIPYPQPMDAPARTLSPAERMKINQAQIKKSMARLTQVVGELQKEFDANNTTTVLSMTAVRKTEEIERLARQIRTLVRG